MVAKHVVVGTSLFLAIAAGAGASPRKLSEGMVPGGGVTGFDLSADGRFVYIGKHDGVRRFDVSSGAVAVVSGAAAPYDLRLSPDGLWLVYRSGDGYWVTRSGSPSPLRSLSAGLDPVPNSDPVFSPDGNLVFLAEDGNAPQRLYSAPLAGGAPTPLVQDVPDGADIRNFALSPDGSKFAYHASRASGVVEDGLYVVASGGGVAETIGTPPVVNSGGGFGGFAWSPDSSRIAFEYTPDRSSPEELHVSTVGTPGSTELARADLSALAFTPDGSRVVYVATTEAFGDRHLFSVAADGSGLPVEHSDHPEIVAGVHFDDFQITADGSHVVFRARVDGFGFTQHQLFSATLAGGSPVALHGALPAGGEVRGFALAGDRVVYRGDVNTNGVVELFGVGLDGMGRVPYGQQPPGGWDVEDDFVVSDDGAWVAFNETADGTRETAVRAAPVAGGTPLLIKNGEGSAFRFSPQSDALYFRQRGAGEQLFRAPLDGGLPADIGGEPSFGGEVSDFAISSDGSVAIYVGEQATSGVSELFQAQVDGGRPEKISAQLELGAEVLDFSLLEDGALAVYRARHEGDSQPSIYAVPTDGSPAYPLVAGTDARRPTRMAVPPSGDRVVYHTFGDDGGSLRVIDADGTGSRQIHGPADPDILFSPDGGRAIYAAWEATDRLLYSVALAGGGPSALATTPLFTNGQEKPVHFTPDGRWIAFPADEDGDGTQELYIADLSTGDRVLVENGAFPQGFSASRLVYSTYPAEGVQHWSRPVTAMAAGATALLPPQSTQTMIVNPNSDRIIVHGDGVDSGSRVILSIPEAGGEPVRLDPVDGVANAAAMRVSPDGSTVVFKAFPPGGPGVVYATSTSGTGPLIVVSPPATSPFNSTAMFTADSSHLLLRGDFVTDGLDELYIVPTAGGEVAKVNAPLAERQDVFQNFAANTDGGRVFYIATHEGSRSPELYLWERAPEGGISCYADFAVAYSLAGGPDDDDDDDGNANLVEYGTGGDPTTTGGASDGGALTVAGGELRFDLSGQPLADLSVEVQGSPDASPGSWGTIATRSPAGVWSSDLTVGETLHPEGGLRTVTVVLQPPADDGSMLYRLAFRIRP